MKKQCLGLILLSIVVAGPGYSEPPPAAYTEAVQRLLKNKFNENEIISFVYQVYAMYDRHVPVERFLPLLASKHLEMRFPETTLRSHTDFRRWYAGIGKTIASNTHTLEGVKVHVLGGGRYQADIVGLWQAESKEGKYVVFKFRQLWTLVNGPGKQPLIQTCLVEAANWKMTVTAGILRIGSHHGNFQNPDRRHHPIPWHAGYGPDSRRRPGGLLRPRREADP